MVGGIRWSLHAAYVALSRGFAIAQLLAKLVLRQAQCVAGGLEFVWGHLSQVAMILSNVSVAMFQSSSFHCVRPCLAALRLPASRPAAMAI